MTLASILKKANYEIVAEAANGEKAIQRYKETKPDLIFMDITMPIMNGLEAIETIMQADVNDKIIVCSAVEQQKVIVQAIELGAKHFNTIPFDETRLLETIERVLHLKINSVTDIM